MSKNGFSGQPSFVRVVFWVFVLIYQSEFIIADADQTGSTKPVQSDIFIVLDNSASMKQLDPSMKIPGMLSDFIKTLPATTRIGLCTYDESAQIILPLTLQGSGNFISTFLDAIKSVTYKGRLRNGPSALVKTISDLNQNARIDTQRYIIYINSGGVDTGDVRKDRELIQWMNEGLPSDAFFNHIRIISIAFSKMADTQNLISIANKTSGKFFQAMKLDDFPDIFTSVGSSLQEIQAPSVPANETTPMTSVQKSFTSYLSEYHTLLIWVGIAFVTLFFLAVLTMIYRRVQARHMHDKILRQRKNLEELRKKQQQSPLKGPPPVSIAQGKAPIQEMPLKRIPEPVPIVQDASIESSVIPEPEVVLPKTDELPAHQFRNQHTPEKREASEQPFVSGKPIDLSPIMPKAKLVDLACITGKAYFSLNKTVTTIGRDKKTNDISIPHETVSKQHARIEFREGNFYLTDMRSTNGTFINGIKISDPNRVAEEPLKHGDRLTFDTFSFQFLLKESDDDKRTIVRFFDDAPDAKKNVGDPFSQTVILPTASEILEDNAQDAPPETGEDEFDAYGFNSGQNVNNAALESAATESSETSVKEDTGITLERIPKACYNHPKEMGKRTCISCNHNFCDQCIVVKDGVNLCKDCAPFYEPDGV